MNKYVLTAVTVISLCSAPAFAVDGTINFTGRILDSGCILSGSGQALSVALPDISKNAFIDAESTASEKKFTLTFANCPADQTASITMKSDNVVAGKPSVLENMGSAENVGIIVENTNGSQIEFNKFSNAGTFDLNGSDTEFTADYVARYYALASTPGPGDVTAAVTLEISY